VHPDFGRGHLPTCGLDARPRSAAQSSLRWTCARTPVKRLMVTILAAALAALYGQRLPAEPSIAPSTASIPAAAHR
jgi:hypothetical protein